MDPDSVIGSVFMLWEKLVSQRLLQKIDLDDDLRSSVTSNLYFEHFLFLQIEKLYLQEKVDTFWCETKSSKSNDFRSRADICINVILVSLQNTVSQLEATLGENIDNWKWSYLSKKILIHSPFSRTPLRFFFEKTGIYGGNRRTVNVAVTSIINENFNSFHSANMRFLTDLDPDSNPLFILDSG